MHFGPNRQIPYGSHYWYIERYWKKPIYTAKPSYDSKLSAYLNPQDLVFGPLDVPTLKMDPFVADPRIGPQINR